MNFDGLTIQQIDEILGSDQMRRPKVDPAKEAAAQQIAEGWNPRPNPADFMYSPKEQALSMDPIYGSPAAKPNPNYDGTKLPWYVSQLVEALKG